MVPLINPEGGSAPPLLQRLSGTRKSSALSLSTGPGVLHAHKQVPPAPCTATHAPGLVLLGIGGEAVYGS